MRTAAVTSILAASVVIASVATTRPAWAGPFDGDLTGTETSVYLKNAAPLHEDATLTTAPDLSGATVLRLRYDNEMYAEFHAVPVAVGQAYALTFKGKWDNRETIETNVSFAAALRDTWELALESMPTLVIEYLDADDAPMKQPRVIATMPYGQWRDYRFAFVPPAGAVKAMVKVKSGRNRGSFLLAAPTLKPQSDSPKALVMSFRRDDANVVGKAYGFLLDGTGQRAADGAILTPSGGGGRTDPFSLAPGTYRMSLKGTPTTNARKVVLTFLDAAGKPTGEASSSELATKLLEFTTPDKTVAGQLMIQNHLLDEIRIERVR